MRRVLWILGVGFAGFFLGGMYGGILGGFLGLLWGTTMGYSFGAIFDQKSATKNIVVYWGVALALLAPVIALLIGSAVLPDTSAVGPVTLSIIGAVAGLFVGLLIGTFHLKHLHRDNLDNRLGED